ncbi:MAG TPA: alpha-E domain-containing protein [Myxococcota bacterium]|jgi:uncharacterized alpha-E superfamily protein
MLSRTADSLFWLARYMERAENVARILSAGHRMASLSPQAGGVSNEWGSTLIAAGCEAGYHTVHGEIEPARVIDFLLRDERNPSSVLSCFETARRNARQVRTALTADMWETLNETWIQLGKFELEAPSPDAMLRFLEWVKHRSLLFNGAYMNTMLRNDAFWFVQVGTYLERADNSARILDVKYHVLLPQGEGVGGPIDHCQWESILRAFSAVRAYHWLYNERIAPWNIAELLILRPEMPRSLLHCSAQLAQALDELATHYGRRAECHRRAGELHARLRFGRVDAVFQQGLHEFLTRFVEDSALLGTAITECYLDSD